VKLVNDIAFVHKCPMEMKKKIVCDTNKKLTFETIAIIQYDAQNKIGKRITRSDESVYFYESFTEN
jgi:hypothetical protein